MAWSTTVRPGGPLVSGPQPPIADFSVAKNNLAVTFADLSRLSPAGGTITTWAWTFGDAGTSALQNPSHTYAAAGTYPVSLTVTNQLGLSHTKTVQVTVSAAPNLGLGQIIGSHNGWATNGPTSFVRVANSSMFNMAQGTTRATGATGQPADIIRWIDAARAAGTKLILMMTGGSASAFLTNSKFDVLKWQARMDTYNTAAIRSAIAAAVLDGTVVFCDILDEPQSSNWGSNPGTGWITKPMLDDMATYVKSIFPTLPCFCSVRHNYRLTDTPYRVLDGVTTQWIQDFESPGQFGSIVNWRNQAYSNLLPDRVQILFSMNIGNGGAGFNLTQCDNPPTGGDGADPGRCAMGWVDTPAYPNGQLMFYGSALLAAPTVADPLGRRSQGLLMWDDPDHLPGYLATGGVQTDMTALRALCDTLPVQSRYRIP
jgi:PKD repeat protein